jgi:hypothetical protein
VKKETYASLYRDRNEADGEHEGRDTEPGGHREDALEERSAPATTRAIPPARVSSAGTSGIAAAAWQRATAG